MAIPFTYVEGTVTTISPHGVKLDHADQWYTRDDKFKGGDPVSLDGAKVRLKGKWSKNGGFYYHGVEIDRSDGDPDTSTTTSPTEDAPFFGSISEPSVIGADSNHSVALAAAADVISRHPVPVSGDYSDPALDPDIALTNFRNLIGKHVILLAMTFTEFLESPAKVLAAYSDKEF